MPTIKSIFRQAKKPDRGTTTLDLSQLTFKQTKLQTWYIEFTDQSGTPEYCESIYDDTLGLYLLGQNYPGTFMFCTRRDASRLEEDPTTFEMDVEYSSAPQPQISSGKYNFQIDVDATEYTQDAWRDKDNKAIANSAGVPFDPTLQKVYYDEVLSVAFDSSDIDTSNIDACRGKVNNGSMTLSIAALNYSRTFAERQMKLRRARYSSKLQGPITSGLGAPAVWSIAYEFLIRITTDPNTGDAAGWEDPVIDRGLNSLSGGQLTPILDATGNAISEPALLDGSGNELSSGGTPHFLVFQIEDEADFSGLMTGIA